MKLRYSIIFLSIFIANVAHAQWSPANQLRTIQAIIIEGPDDGSVAHVVFNNQFNPAGCTGSLTYNEFDASTPRGRNMLSLLLSAKAKGVAIRTDVDPNSCSTFRDLNRPIIRGVWEP